MTTWGLPDGCISILGTIEIYVGTVGVPYTQVYIYTVFIMWTMHCLYVAEHATNLVQFLIHAQLFYSAHILASHAVTTHSQLMFLAYNDLKGGRPHCIG